MSELSAAFDFLSSGGFDPARPLTASGNLRRRHALSSLVGAIQTASALLALAVLGILVFSVAQHGASVLSLEFLTSGPPLHGEEAGGGVAPEIVGTLLMMLVATAIAMPLGVLIAIYITEFASARPARAIRMALDLMNGLPTIVVGLFIFGLLVVGHGQSGFAGSLALSIIMLPLIARAAQEVLVLVPKTLREAADALGVSRWRAVLGVVLPSALGGIVTATVLAGARAAGETAPLLFLSSIFSNSTTLNLSGAVPNIPVYIFTASEEANQFGFARAWGAAFVLLAAILVANLVCRALMNRNRAKLTR